MNATRYREAGLAPYHPELKLNPLLYFNYNQTVDRLRNIYSIASGLESTSLVLACGLGQFHTFHSFFIPCNIVAQCAKPFFCFYFYRFVFHSSAAFQAVWSTSRRLWLQLDNGCGGSHGSSDNYTFKNVCQKVSQTFVEIINHLSSSKMCYSQVFKKCVHNYNWREKLALSNDKNKNCHESRPL